MTDKWDDTYFKTENQQATAEAVAVNQMSVGPKFLNHLEAETYADMIAAIRKAGLDRVGFSIIDEDTGAETILVPMLDEFEQQLLNFMHDEFKPLIAAARAKGKFLKGEEPCAT